MDQLASADGESPAGEGRAGPVLDLFLRQLDPHASPRPVLGGEVSGRRPGGDRGARAGVRVRAGARQRALGQGDLRDRVSDRHRQRLRGLARVRQQLWPALYLIDGQGRVRHRHFGEGDYERSERVIQELLAEAGARGVERDLVSAVPQGAEAPVRFRLRIDGKAPGVAHGSDVDEEGNGTVAEPRMYQRIRQPGRVADHRFEIQFLDQDVEVFVFTFG